MKLGIVISGKEKNLYESEQGVPNCLIFDVFHVSRQDK